MITKRQKAKWRTLVGTAVLSFCDIEFITQECLKHLPTDNIYKSVSTLPFSRRVDLIIEILQGWSNTPKAATTLIEKLKLAKKLFSEYRNVLVHNPLAVDIYVQHETDDIVFDHNISSERKNKKTINLTSLKKLAYEVKDLASELYMTLEKVIKKVK
jgi:hypothetical protein